MVSCQLLYQIHKALCLAKGNTDMFGGINIIFAGDFAQLAPVGGTCLYRPRGQDPSDGGTQRGQEAVQGRLLWLSINTVVQLTESMRQCGAENVRFLSLLRRLRVGHVIADPEWQKAPVIVSHNNQKDAMNEEYAKRFADETGQTLHWYYAQD
ncbi:hypothetical protein BDN72DRAFT_739887, partial [Pluteus cervinus]